MHSSGWPDRPCGGAVSLRIPCECAAQTKALRIRAAAAALEVTCLLAVIIRSRGGQRRLWAIRFCASGTSSSNPYANLSPWFLRGEWQLRTLALVPCWNATTTPIAAQHRQWCTRFVLGWCSRLAAWKAGRACALEGNPRLSARRQCATGDEQEHEWTHNSLMHSHVFTQRVLVARRAHPRGREGCRRLSGCEFACLLEYCSPRLGQNFCCECDSQPP